MKKHLLYLVTLLVALALLTACGGPAGSADGETNAETVTLKVGASITPHAEILGQVVDALAAQGIKLEIVEFTDYVQPNLAVENGDLDANYFQHIPYLEQFNADEGTHLTALSKMHYEAMALYKGRLQSLDELYDGATVAVPNDVTNEARALLLLEANGLLTLKAGADLNATVLDIAENPHGLKIVEMEAAQISLALPDVDFGVINGNYALQAGLTAQKDAVATEGTDSEAANTFPNVLCVKEGREKDPALLALAEALQSDAVREYILKTYGGVVVPLF